MRRRAATAVVAGAVALLAAGCGGDAAPIEQVTTDAEPSGGSAISTDEFIEAADARCAESAAAIANLSPVTEGDGLAVVAEQERQITAGVLSGLRSLGDPEDPDGSLARYYDALEDELDLLDQQQSAASGDDAGAYDALTDELAQAQADARVAAEEFGFAECGQEGPETGSPATTTTPPPSAATTTTPVPTTTTPVPTAPAPEAPAPIPEAPAAPPGGGTGPGGGGGGSGGGSSGGLSP